MGVRRFRIPETIARRFAAIEFDHDLAQRLFDLPEVDSARLFEALTEFNSANTDSGDVPDHVEVVMMKSAFEWLLNIATNSKDFVNALQSCLTDTDPEPWESGPIENGWLRRFPRAVRPLHAWAQEFCDLRGAAAHAADRNADRFVWNIRAHLAFASMLFPLLVKKRLEAAGHWVLSDFDAQKLRRIDSYLMHDPLLHDPIKSDDSNPWSELDSHAFIAAKAHKFYLPPTD